MIEDEGGADIIYSATGWPGHMAFIDPGMPEHKGMDDTLEDFIKIKSGLVTPSVITVCEDSLMPQVGAAGDLWAVPPRAATIGPYDVVNAKERCIVHDGALPNGWQKMVSRMELYGEISKDCPSSIARLGKGVCYLAEAQATPIKHWFYGMKPRDL
jgi:glucosamine-6-phosphate deaminase